MSKWIGLSGCIKKNIRLLRYQKPDLLYQAHLPIL